MQATSDANATPATADTAARRLTLQRATSKKEKQYVELLFHPWRPSVKWGFGAGLAAKYPVSRQKNRLAVNKVVPRGFYIKRGARWATSKRRLQA
jgi:hypothetical protein